MRVSAARAGDEESSPVIDRLRTLPATQASAALLADHLGDPDPRVREEAVRGLGRLGPLGRIGVPGLVDLLLREEAVPDVLRALAAIGPAADEALPFLAERAKAGDARASVALAAVGPGGPDRLARLREALASPDPAIRAEGAASFESLARGSADVEAALVALARARRRGRARPRRPGAPRARGPLRPRGARPPRGARRRSARPAGPRPGGLRGPRARRARPGPRGAAAPLRPRPRRAGRRRAGPRGRRPRRSGALRAAPGGRRARRRSRRAGRRALRDRPDRQERAGAAGGGPGVPRGGSWDPDAGRAGRRRRGSRVPGGRRPRRGPAPLPGKRQDPSLLEDIATQLADPRAQNRRWAVSMLAGLRLPPSEILRLLVPHLDDPDPVVSTGACEAIGALGAAAAPAVEALAARARGEEGWAAANALLQIGDPATRALVDLLGSTDPEVSVRTLWSLDEASPTELAARPGLLPAYLDALLRAWPEGSQRDETWEDLLRATGEPLAYVPRVCDAVRRAEDGLGAIDLVTALMHLGPAGIDAALRLLETDDEGVRSAVANAASEPRDDRLWPALAPYLRHRDPYVRAAATDLVARVEPPPPDVFPLLVDLLRDRHPRVRRRPRRPR